MRMRIHETDIQVAASAYILLAFALILIPVPWVTAWLTAMIIHESGHYFAIRLCRERVISVTLGMQGTSMLTDPMSDRKEILCALAGPLSGLLLLLFFRFIPRIAVCALFQALYNLLPVYPLDGGRALRGLFRQCMPRQKADKLMELIRKVILLMVATTIIYMTVWLHIGLLPSAFIMLPLLKKVKTPCKRNVCTVQ